MSGAPYVPCKGDFFYTKALPWDRVIGGMDFLSGTVTKERVVAQQDNSYRDEVWKCIARDDHMVVTAHERPGLLHGKPLLLPRDRWEFFPVGPEVLRALNLVNDGEAE